MKGSIGASGQDAERLFYIVNVIAVDDKGNYGEF